VTHLFGYSLDTIALAWLIISVVLLLGLALCAARRPILLRIALRQLPRRRVLMVLVALGLSLGASIFTSVFLTGDTVQTAIHVEVVAGLGRTDEILHDAGGPYTRGDVDISALTGLDTGAPGAATQAVFLDELSGHLVTQGTACPGADRGSDRLHSGRPVVSGLLVVAGQRPGPTWLTAFANGNRGLLPGRDQHGVRGGMDRHV